MISVTPKEKNICQRHYRFGTNLSMAKDRVCLIGDAAHATTPNMGQGACQAIEDAYILGKLFGEGKTWMKSSLNTKNCV